MVYTIEVEVEGIAPLLQHAFGKEAETEAGKSSKKVSGKRDYSNEWRDTCYVTPEGELYQPARHFEAAMENAAVIFKIPGRGRKTYRDLFKAVIAVRPYVILHGKSVPENPPVNDDSQDIYIDLRPVVVVRARVMRARLAFAPGWKLAFTIKVDEDQVPAEVVNEVLVEAGKTVGVGDYRPKFGRFMVTNFSL